MEELILINEYTGFLQAIEIDDKELEHYRKLFNEKEHID